MWSQTPTVKYPSDLNARVPILGPHHQLILKRGPVGLVPSTIRDHHRNLPPRSKKWGKRRCFHLLTCWLIVVESCCSTEGRTVFLFLVPFVFFFSFNFRVGFLNLCWGSNKDGTTNGLYVWTDGRDSWFDELTLHVGFELYCFSSTRRV